MEFIEASLGDKKSQKFLENAKNMWSEYFDIEVLPLVKNKNSSAWCILAEENSEIIAGAIISEKNVNILTGKAGEYTKNLENSGYKNFSYFVVDEKYRKKGVGSKFLNFIKLRYKKNWFDSRPHNFDFYEKRGGIKKIKEDGDSDGFVFIF